MSNNLFQNLSAVCVLLLAGNAAAEIRLPHVFASHMVLQQQKPVVLWGWAAPGEAVSVDLAGNRQQGKANENGEWRVVLPALQAGGPLALSVTGSNTIKLDDILVGEVWLCSGQSNMEMGIGMANNAKEEIAAADYPQIRLMLVPKALATLPQSDVDATWKPCAPQTIAEGGWGGFSAAAYYFGRELHQKLKVPVGLIASSWGGTRIEPWTPPVGFAGEPALKPIHDSVMLADPRSESYQQRLNQYLTTNAEWSAAARKALAAQAAVPTMPAYPAELAPLTNNQQPTALYNAMIHPLVPLALRGCIWYQGESNHNEGMLYVDKTRALVNGWRKVFRQEDLAYYYVQIAPFKYGTEDPAIVARFWEAQAAAMAIPNTGMIVTTDIGDVADIHPKNKQEVGRRLALWALAKTYQRPDIICSGPVFKTLTVEGNKLRLSFDQVGAGLASRDGKPLSWFEIIDRDNGGFVPATATIDGNTVLLAAEGVKNPAAMRFAWSMLAEPNFSNKDGLPAQPFRAGEVPVHDSLMLNVPEAQGFQLVYDLDLSKAAHEITYEADNHAAISKPFDRIAYYLELTGADQKQQYVYVSMDAFTKESAKIGVPCLASGARFQQNLSRMTVLSNVSGVVTGTNLAGGNIEFWPNNYGPGNGGNVPNADAATYDFGDDLGPQVDGYGSMQIHNHDAKQTVMAINNWAGGQGGDLGIGNCPGANPDWTFARNAASYTAKRLRVLVHCP